MNWNNIRLELASNKEFPRGSASRAFLLRLPLNDDGSIDTASVERDPAQATVRRYWASEPDQSGRVFQQTGEWILNCLGASRVASNFRLGSKVLRLGQPVCIRTPDGSKLPFRVTSISPLGNLAARCP